MLKLKLQYFGHLMQRADSFEKALMLGKIEGRRRRGLQRLDGWMASLLDGHEFGQTPGVGDGRGCLACCSPWDHRVGHDWVTELNWKYIIEKNKRQKRKIWHFYQNTFLVISAYKKNKAIIISETVMKRARKIVKPAVILGNTNSMISWGLRLKVNQ